MRHLKAEFDKLTFKEVVVITLAAVGQIAATVLVYLGLYLEPRGVIHASVLTYYGIASSFSSALLGISYYYSAELKNFKKYVSEWIAKPTDIPPDNTP